MAVDRAATLVFALCLSPSTASAFEGRRLMPRAPALPAHGPGRLWRGAWSAMLTETFRVRGRAPLGLILEEREVGEALVGEREKAAGAAGGQGVRRHSKKKRVVVVGVREEGSIGGGGLVRVGDEVVALSGTFGDMWAVGVGGMGGVQGVLRAVQSWRGSEGVLEVRREVNEGGDLETLVAEWERLARVGRGEVVRARVEEALEDAVGRLVRDKGRWAEREIEAMVRRVQRAGMSLGLKAWNAVMTAYVKCGCAERAAALFREIEQPSVECYTTYVSALAALRRSKEALGTLEEMRSRGVRPNIRTFNAVITACVRDGRLRRARVLFGEMCVDGVQPDVVSWNIIINWHVRQKRGYRRLEGATQAFADMRASGVEPNLVTYTTLMKAYAKSGRTGKAESILNDMKSLYPAIRIDTHAYNTLIEAFARRLDWRRCVELLYEMKHERLALRFTEKLNGAPPYFKGRSGQREWRSEQDVIQDSKGLLESDPALAPADDDSYPPRPNAQTYALVIKACADSGQIERAEAHFEELLEAGFCPPPYQAILSLMGAFARAGLLTKCYGLLQRTKLWKIRPQQAFLSALMHCSLQNGKPGLALEIYSKMKALQIRPDAITHTMLLKAYCLVGEFGSAFNILRAMSRSEDQKPTIVTYNMLLELTLAAGRPDLALRALGLLLRRSEALRPNRATLDALVPPLDLEPRRRLEFLMEARRRLRESDAWANGRLYVGLLEACAECEEWEIGRKLLDDRENTTEFRVSRADLADVEECERDFRQRILRVKVGLEE